jgi:hypothetical protein
MLPNPWGEYVTYVTLAPRADHSIFGRVVALAITVSRRQCGLAFVIDTITIGCCWNVVPVSQYLVGPIASVVTSPIPSLPRLDSRAVDGMAEQQATPQENTGPRCAPSGRLRDYSVVQPQK